MEAGAAAPALLPRWRRARSRTARTPVWLLVPSLLVLTLIVFLPVVLAVYVSTTALSVYTIGDVLHLPQVWLSNYWDVLNPSSALNVLNQLRTSVLFSLL